MDDTNEKEHGSSAETSATKAPSTEKKWTILVVDDDAMIRQLFKIILSNAGFSVIDAGDAREGLRKVRENPKISLALIDIDMPEIDGIQLVKMIRNQHFYTNLPIIMATGKSSKDCVVQSIKAGVQDYIVKPVDKKSLVEKICKQLDIEPGDVKGG